MKFTDNAMSVHLLRRDNGGYQTPATPADITACLAANPEAARKVWDALGAQVGQPFRETLARAEQAERERDEARALAEERRDYARAQNAKLSVENDALRSRLAKTDAVVEAATHRSYVFSIPEWERWRDSLRSALRALDEDSGGLGAATGNTASPVPDMPAQAGEQPGGGDTTSGDTRPPAPAGSYRVPIGCGVAAVDSAGRVIWWEPGDPLSQTPEAPATRREVEELRVRVGRLENLVDKL